MTRKPNHNFADTNTRFFDALENRMLMSSTMVDDGGATDSAIENRPVVVQTFEDLAGNEPNQLGGVLLPDILPVRASAGGDAQHNTASGVRVRTQIQDDPFFFDAVVETESGNNLKQFGLAAHNHHDVHDVGEPDGQDLSIIAILVG